MTSTDRQDPPAGLRAAARTGTAVARVPAQLREIAEVAGTDAALAILKAKGGTEVWIPHRAEPGHWLAQLVGDEAAERICAFYTTAVNLQLRVAEHLEKALAPRSGRVA